MKKLSYALNILGLACILGAIWVFFFGLDSYIWMADIFFLSGIFGSLFVLAAAWVVIDIKWRIGSILGMPLFVLYMALSLASDYFPLEWFGVYVFSVLNLFVVAVPFVLSGIAVKSLPDARHRRLLRAGLACGYLIQSFYLFMIWPPVYIWPT